MRTKIYIKSKTFIKPYLQIKNAIFLIFFCINLSAETEVNQSYSQKLHNAMNFIQLQKNYRDQAYEINNQIMDSLTSHFSNGEYSSFHSLSRDAIELTRKNDGDKKISLDEKKSLFEKLRNIKLEVYNNTDTLLQERIDQETDSLLKNYLIYQKKNQPDAYAEEKIRQIVRRIFPKEINALIYLYNALDKNSKNYFAALDNNDMEIPLQIINEEKSLRARLHKLTSANPKLDLVDTLYRFGLNSINTEDPNSDVRKVKRYRCYTHYF